MLYICELVVAHWPLWLAYLYVTSPKDIVSIHHSNGCKLVRAQLESIIAFMDLIFEEGISSLWTFVDLIFESWCFSMSS